MDNKDSDNRTQLLIESVFDGESSTSQADTLRVRLKESHSALREEWEALGAVREEVQKWHADLRCDASGRERNVDLWARISSDIRRSENVAREGGILEQFVSQLRALMSMPLAAGAMAVVAVGIYSVFSVPDTTQPSQIALSTGVSSSEAELKRVGEVRSVAPLAIPDAMAVAYRNGIMNNRSMRVPFVPPSDRDFVLGGLRAHGVDIDWVKSEKPVKILPLEDDEGAPPILWVARRNPTIDAYAGLD